jgi:hypothetical protein
MPERSFVASPSDRPLVEPLLPVSEIAPSTDNVRWIKAAGLAPGVERLADPEIERFPTAVFHRKSVGLGICVLEPFIWSLTGANRIALAAHLAFPSRRRLWAPNS